MVRVYAKCYIKAILVEMWLQFSDEVKFCQKLMTVFILCSRIDSSEITGSKRNFSYISL